MILSALGKSLSSAANVFRLMLLAIFLHRPAIHILLPSLSVRFIWLYRVFATSFIYRLAAYPADNNWGLVDHDVSRWKEGTNFYTFLTTFRYKRTTAETTLHLLQAFTNVSYIIQCTKCKVQYLWGLRSEALLFYCLFLSCFVFQSINFRSERLIGYHETISVF